MATDVEPVASASVTYLGHATVLVEMDGVRVLTDPLLRNHAAHIRRYGPAVPTGDIEPDIVIVSHAHRDHLDLPSLRAVARGCPLVVPRGCARLLTRKGLDHVVEVDVGESLGFGSVAVRATRAVHDGRRSPLGPPLPALGFVIEGSRRAYFAGDTDLFPEMAELSDGLDVALLPVAGWGPRLGPGHLDPPRAAEAVALLRPRFAVPIHWGTFAAPGARPSDPESPAREFAGHVARLAPEVEVRTLSPGASLQLPPGAR